MGFLALLAVAVPSIAYADVTVIVLGVRSVEGDDEFARDLTSTLRQAASQVEGWAVSDREVSLAQMTLVHGCDEPDAQCMSQISQALQVQRVIYGTVRRTGTRQNSDFSLTLYLFDAEASEITGTVTDGIPNGQRDVDDLAPRARGYIRSLMGASDAGSIRIATNLPGAQILLDGDEVGITGEDGSFTATNVSPGSHRIEVTAENHQRFRGTVTVAEGEEASLEVTLQEGEDTSGGGGGGGGGGGFNILGWGLVGVGVVGMALTIFSWTKINSIDSDDSAFGRYRENRVPLGMDTCDYAEARRDTEADARAAFDLCGSASTWQTLQWVFMGLAVVGGGVGAILLAGDELGGEAEAEAEVSTARLELRPSLGLDGGGLSALLTF